MTAVAVHAEAHDPGNLIAFATPGFPLCGQPVKRVVETDGLGGLRQRIITRMSDTWRGVTCKKCLAWKTRR